MNDNASIEPAWMATFAFALACAPNLVFAAEPPIENPVPNTELHGAPVDPPSAPPFSLSSFEPTRRVAETPPPQVPDTPPAVEDQPIDDESRPMT